MFSRYSFLRSERSDWLRLALATSSRFGTIGFTSRGTVDGCLGVVTQNEAGWRLELEESAQGTDLFEAPGAEVQVENAKEEAIDWIADPLGVGDFEHEVFEESPWSRPSPRKQASSRRG